MEAVRTLLGISSGVLVFVAAIPYALDILRGNTKPERAAFIIWALTSTVAFFSYWADGAGHSLWLAFGDFIVGIAILALALKYGYGWVKGRDTVGISVALVGVVLWLLTDEPFIALFLSVCIDAVGSLLVAIKAYEAPDTEYMVSWLIYLVAAVFAILAIDQFSFAMLLYPVYALVSAIGIVTAILMGRKNGRKRINSSRKRAEKIV